MLARREALLSAGLLDERFFIYSEEPDLCLRIRRAGWEMRHLPDDDLHHAGKAGINPRMEAQNSICASSPPCAHSLREGPPARVPRRAFPPIALRARHAGGWGPEATQRREASRWALKVLWGIETSPFGDPARAGGQARGPRRGSRPAPERFRLGSVLFFAYHFPPVGGAGVQRPARFVRYLPDHGYRPIVVTGPGVAPGRWTPEDDHARGGDPARRRRSTAYRGPNRQQEGRGEQLKRWLRQPSSWSHWWVDGTSAAGRAARAAGADLDLHVDAAVPDSTR